MIVLDKFLSFFWCWLLDAAYSWGEFRIPALFYSRTLVLWGKFIACKQIGKDVFKISKFHHKFTIVCSNFIRDRLWPFGFLCFFNFYLIIFFKIWFKFVKVFILLIVIFWMITPVEYPFTLTMRISNLHQIKSIIFCGQINVF